MFFKLLFQALLIIGLSAFIALGTNALRSDGLPLVHAQSSSVKLENGKKEITIKDAAMLFLSQRAVFIDARTKDEYDDGHIQGALNVPVDYFDDFFEEIKPKLQGKEAVITYCDGEQCELSHDLAEILREEGINNVWVLHNGWSLWKAEKLPVAPAGTTSGLSTRGGAPCTS